MFCRDESTLFPLFGLKEAGSVDRQMGPPQLHHRNAVQSLSGGTVAAVVGPHCLKAVACHGAVSDCLYLKWGLAVVVFQFLVSTPKQQHSGTAVLQMEKKKSTCETVAAMDFI